MSGVKKKGGYDVRFFANEAPSASFVKALFSEAVKVEIAQKTKYHVHYKYYTPAEPFYKAEGRGGPRNLDRWLRAVSAPIMNTELEEE